MKQLAAGLAQLHATGVLHRNVKADSAVVANRDPLVVKWTDFGCAVPLGSRCYGDGERQLHSLVVKFRLFTSVCVFLCVFCVRICVFICECLVCVHVCVFLMCMRMPCGFIPEWVPR